jgi:hypothetical protein
MFEEYAYGYRHLCPFSFLLYCCIIEIIMVGKADKPCGCCVICMGCTGRLFWLAVITISKKPSSASPNTIIVSGKIRVYQKCRSDKNQQGK